MQFLVAVLGLCGSTATRVFRQGSSHGAAAYETFRNQFGTDRTEDTAGYQVRLALFQKRQEEVMKHNARSDKLWVAAVNKFADYTDAEFEALLGHRPSSRSTRKAMQQSSSFLQMGPSETVIAQARDWREQLNGTGVAKDQGGCGSCWAVAAAGALEAHGLIAGISEEFSYEELVDCVENPQECGGTGGCSGATAELAFEYVKNHGLAKKADYKGYQSGGDKKCKPPTNPVISTTGFERLAENKYQPLLEAIANSGPVVVSADASGWGSYSSGVFDSCSKDATINHAILLMGYGTDSTLNKDYWLIRNSWGATWGESGFIRLLRDSADDYCGTDHAPQEGVACKGGPSETEVCGMCGVYSDSSYPIGLTLNTAK